MFVQLRRQQQRLASSSSSSDCSVVGTTAVSCFLLQLWMRILLTHWTTVQIAHSERRCYCNDVSCVTTGYMCKSSVGVCFSQTTHDGASRFRFYHACAEMLPEHHADVCAGGMEVGSRVTARSEVVQIACCETDMCNYNREAARGHQGEGQLRPPSANLNNQQTDEGGHFVHHPPGDQQRASAADRHVWFQALVIAVSLIGTVVLLFLLLVTVKILVLNQRRRHPPAASRSRSRSSKATDDVIDVTNLNLYPDERVRCHVIGPEAEMDRSCCCCCEDEEKGGRKEGLKEGKSGRLTGCGKVGGDVGGGKVFPVSYQCVAFTAAGENAFRTDLVPYPHHHHHHAYLLDHHHHCRHFPHHCNRHSLPRYPHLNPREKCRRLSNDIQSNEALPKNI